MDSSEDRYTQASKAQELAELINVQGDEFFSEDESEYWHQVMGVILNNLPVILCRIDQNGVFKKVTGKGLKFSGMVAEDFTGKNIFDIYPQISSSVKQLLEGKAVSFITSIRHAEKTHYFENYYFPEKNGSVGFILDITDRKLAEEKIKKSESLLLETQELAQMGTWEWDPGTNRMIWSNEMFRIFGLEESDEAVKYLDYIRQIHPDDVSGFRKTIGKVFEEHRSFKYEHRIIREDGQVRVIYGQGNPVINDFGIVRVYGFCQDITERKEIEEQLKQKNRELNEAKQALIEVNEDLEQKVQERTAALSVTNEQLLKINSDLDNFVYAASHDLKAPIANIEGLVNTLTGILPDPDEEVIMVIGMINQSISRFRSTIGDLAEITKIQKNIEEEIEEVNIRDLTNEIQVDLQKEISESNADVLLDTEIENICFTRKNLRSILYNLISNAIKYRSPERSPRVEVKTRNSDKFLLLEVHDNGLGFEQDQAEKIFSMFKRLHNHVEGSGIGLYLVNRIVENSEGRIEVESKKGVGSSFIIYLKKNEAVPV